MLVFVVVFLQKISHCCSFPRVCSTLSFRVPLVVSQGIAQPLFFLYGDILIAEKLLSNQLRNYFLRKCWIVCPTWLIDWNSYEAWQTSNYTLSQRCQDLCSKVHDHVRVQSSLFLAWTLCLVILVSSSVPSKQLLKIKTNNKDICQVSWPFTSI